MHYAVRCSISWPMDMAILRKRKWLNECMPVLFFFGNVKLEARQYCLFVLLDLAVTSRM